MGFVVLKRFEWFAGWFLGAYFLGGYEDDGKGVNGLTKAVFAAVKSWAVGISVSCWNLFGVMLWSFVICLG